METESRDLEYRNIDILNSDELSELILIVLQKLIVQHTLCFMELLQRFGPEKSLDMVDDVWENIYRKQIEAINKLLGFDLEAMLPVALADMPAEEISKLFRNIILFDP